LTLPLVAAACGSTPPVCPPQTKPPAPAAWAMQKPQNLMGQLNKIISVSEK
ncbi:TPA: hypothetical protein J1416_002956, partial [Escherichia coli]|nr:hypothetical protein [Escherichia coli]